jgi:isopentenyl-diphosphate delta-isomerase
MDRVVHDAIILVDPKDRPIGVAPKRTVHLLGLRHRAFSILLWDDVGRVLLQRRAPDKYHSGGLWANSCCGHPRPGESTQDAAARRVHEELGVRARLSHAGTFTYRAAVGPGMIEHEIDHVFVGTASGELQPDPREVAAVAWISVDELSTDLRANSHLYAAWLADVIRVGLHAG